MNTRTAPVAVVTPTYNRAHLLGRLAESLKKQTDSNFVWVVIDDCSTDTTADLMRELQSTFADRLIYTTNEDNVGKSASLNRAFRIQNAEAYVIVDSDDCLLPTAIAIIKSKKKEYYKDRHVGAMLFDYVDTAGRLLRHNASVREDHVCTRTQYNDIYGKWDGCIVYFDRTVSRVQYPEYSGENYVGPTVLQMLMHPDEIAFIPQCVGVAEYQPEGLTKRGRALRVQNPRGMMDYSRLNALQTQRTLTRLKHLVAYEAYLRIARGAAKGTLESPKSIKLESRAAARSVQVGGTVLSAYWRLRHGVKND